MAIVSRRHVPTLVTLLGALAHIGGAGAQDVAVTSADPEWATPGTTDLIVALTGSGLDAVTAVKFTRAETSDQNIITVRRISVLNSRTLLALVAVAEDAVAAIYDIEVEGQGHSSRGTKLFSVHNKRPDDSFGCMGIEVWLRHRYCKRGRLDRPVEKR